MKGVSKYERNRRPKRLHGLYHGIPSLADLRAACDGRLAQDGMKPRRKKLTR